MVVSGAAGRLQAFWWPLRQSKDANADERRRRSSKNNCAAECRARQTTCLERHRMSRASQRAARLRRRHRKASCGPLGAFRSFRTAFISLMKAAIRFDCGASGRVIGRPSLIDLDDFLIAPLCGPPPPAV